MIDYSEVQTRQPVNPVLSAMPVASFWRELLDAIPIVIFVRGARSALGPLLQKRTSR